MLYLYYTVIGTDRRESKESGCGDEARNRRS